MLKSRMAAIGLCMALVACAPPPPGGSAPNPIQTVLDNACPPLAVLQAGANNGTVKLNATQSKYLAAVLTACPPNPPPTTTLAAGVDIVEAVAILQPLYSK